MNDQRLRLDLTALADEVTSVDLRDRTLRTSRRLGIQRAVATSAAALVLIAAAAGTAFAIRPDQSPPPLPADTPSVTASPSPTPTPTPTPSGSAGDTPGAPPSGGSSTSTPSVQFGRLFYGPATVTDAEMANLRSWRPGDSPVRLLALPELAAIGSANISPDGRRVAWVESDDSESTLVIADVDGSGRQEMRSKVDPHCAPAWSADGRHLLFIETKAMGETVRHGVLDTRSDKRTVTWWPGQPRGCHALWSADGRTIAMTDYLGVALFGTDGTKKRAVPGFAVGKLTSNDIASLSSDGSRIALLVKKPNEDAGDVARELWANAVIDTRTGKQVTLPLGGRTLRQVYFQTDGSMVVRVKTSNGYAVLLVDEDGRKISETAEPASLKDMQILAVVD
ncbi:LpqB family beta-propeller domain-containing protein [Micromonospora sp. NPDC047753]|uniref:LpqB family beta-propeller domain-containing protein n=1 Tax=Micromonospora sp. NPDC047753 TaxID=3154817 RepID=UPI00340AE5CF